MIERHKGHIVNVASYCAFLASNTNYIDPDYAASMAALSAFHNALRLELKYQKTKIITSIIFPYI